MEARLDQDDGLRRRASRSSTSTSRKRGAAAYPLQIAEWTLQRALDAELEYIAATKCASTLPPYRTSAAHLTRVLGAGKILKTITGEDLRAYQVARRRAGRAPKTINNEILVLRAVLKRAKLWAVIEPDYKPLKVPKNGPGVAITPEQAETLFSLRMQNPDGSSVYVPACLRMRPAVEPARSDRCSFGTWNSVAVRQ